MGIGCCLPAGKDIGNKLAVSKPCNRSFTKKGSHLSIAAQKLKRKIN
jgi:hypothetical protein